MAYSLLYFRYIFVTIEEEDYGLIKEAKSRSEIEKARRIEIYYPVFWTKVSDGKLWQGRPRRAPPACTYACIS